MPSDTPAPSAMPPPVPGTPPLPDAPPAAESPSATVHPDVGLEIGSYRVIDVLGEGGMGLVYLAEHIRLGRKVAIKRLKDRLAAKPEAVQQFFEEARAVNRINHPHIVDITDFVAEPGRAYYLMEYLQGETLADLIRREKVLPSQRVIHIMRQVCAALEAAHSAGFIHLDIKPSNIFLLEDPQRPDRVKLLDFGTAQLTQTMPRSISSIGRKSAVFSMGTPVYMSPEQAAGEEVDHRSDLYSTGAVLYEALTGQPPFVAQSAPEYIYKHMSVAPKRLTQVKGLPYKIPRRCAQAVMACLEKDPADRPESAAALSEMLQRGNTITQGQVAVGLPGSAVPAGRAKLWGLIGSAALGLVALIVGGVLLFGGVTDDPEALRPSGLALSTAQGEGTLDELTNRPKHAMLLIKTAPPMAQVNLVEPDQRQLGITPLLYRAPRGSKQWTLVITAEGHKPRTITVLPDQDRTLQIALEPLPAMPEAELEKLRDKADDEAGKKRSDRRKRRRRARRDKKKRDQDPAARRRRSSTVNTINPFGD